MTIYALWFTCGIGLVLFGLFMCTDPASSLRLLGFLMVLMGIGLTCLSHIKLAEKFKEQIDEDNDRYFDE